MKERDAAHVEVNQSGKNGLTTDVPHQTTLLLPSRYNPLQCLVQQRENLHSVHSSVSTGQTDRDLLLQRKGKKKGKEKHQRSGKDLQQKAIIHKQGGYGLGSPLIPADAGDVGQSVNGGTYSRPLSARTKGDTAKQHRTTMERRPCHRWPMVGCGRYMERGGAKAARAFLAELKKKPKSEPACGHSRARSFVRSVGAHFVRCPVIKNGAHRRASLSGPE
jgi:hypothetical protein